MDSGDIVTWRAGRTGKGWVSPDGRVRAWSVSAHEEAPHHKDVEHSEGSVRFRVSPEGVVEVHGGTAFMHERAQAAIDAALSDAS